MTAYCGISLPRSNAPHDHSFPVHPAVSRATRIETSYAWSRSLKSPNSIPATLDFSGVVSGYRFQIGYLKKSIVYRVPPWSNGTRAWIGLLISRMWRQTKQGRPGAPARQYQIDVSNS